jgi:hypothetical protein
MSEIRKCLESLMMAFFDLRKVCGNHIPVKDNPTKSMCHKSINNYCHISECPLLKR